MLVWIGDLGFFLNPSVLQSVNGKIWCLRCMCLCLGVVWVLCCRVGRFFVCACILGVQQI